MVEFKILGKAFVIIKTLNYRRRNLSMDRLPLQATERRKAH